MPIETNINNFMQYYRDTFPAASVLPKMHILEGHLVPFIQKWDVGLGLLAEQGAKSIHAAMNIKERAYKNIPNDVVRLKYLLQEHHRQVCPVLAKEQPLIKRRKLDS